jgi:hypothetical protein
MRKLAIAAVVALLAVTAVAGEKPEEAPVPFEEVEVMGLLHALKAGVVRAGGEEPKSYRGVTLVIENRTGSRRAIDVAGHYLRPRTRGSVQRLGLGPTRDPVASVQRGPGTVVINLGPGETKRVEMRTVCLDAGGPAPKNQRFDAADDALPAVREKVLRWWADHPAAPQGAVNSAIWQFRDTVVLPVGSWVPKGRFAALHAGTLFDLSDGELLSRDADGVERFLGTQIHRVFPGPSAVFAVAPADRGRPELWRLALTGGKPWSKVAVLDGRERVFDVFSAGKKVVVVTSSGVTLIDEQTSRRAITAGQDGLLRISAVPSKGGRILVVTRERGTRGYWQGGEQKDKQADTVFLRTVDTKTGAVKVLKRYWNVKDAAVGAAGVYALSHGGALRVLSGKSFRALGPAVTWERIVAVGRKGVWLATAKGDLALVTAKSGAVRHRFAKAAAELSRIAIDPVTDDLAAIRDQRIVLLRAENGIEEEAKKRAE